MRIIHNNEPTAYGHYYIMQLHLEKIRIELFKMRLIKRLLSGCAGSRMPRHGSSYLPCRSNTSISSRANGIRRALEPLIRLRAEGLQALLDGVGHHLHDLEAVEIGGNR